MGSRAREFSSCGMCCAGLTVPRQVESSWTRESCSLPWQGDCETLEHSGNPQSPGLHLCPRSAHTLAASSALQALPGSECGRNLEGQQMDSSAKWGLFKSASEAFNA